MNKMLSKALICALTAAFVFTGCQKKEQTAEPAKPTAKETVTAIDMLGRTVEVPAEPQRIMADRILPLPSTYFVATQSDMTEVLAMHPASKSAAINSMLNIMAPAIADTKTDIFNGNTPNIEEVMKINPDLVFAYADIEGAIEPYEKAGITALGMLAASAAGGDSIETLRGWFDVLQYTGGDKERMDALLEDGENAKQMIADTLAANPDAEKPKAVFIFSFNNNNLEVAGSNFFSEYWLANTGAEDPAAKDFSGRKVVNMEQLYSWNPDIIYITNFTSLVPEDILENKIAGQDWSSIDAVKSGKVYKIPLGIYRWFPPSGDTPLMLKWLAQKNHPELFTYSIEDEIKAYYKKFYNYELTEEEITFILNPAKAAAAGYSTGS